MKVNNEVTRRDVVRYLVKTKSKKKHTATPKKYPQGYFNDKGCRATDCNNTFAPKAPSEHYCSDDCANIGFTEKYLKRTYNITLDQYVDIYIRQKGKCRICKTDGFQINRSAKVKLCIDHCHATGVFRGLLCPNCNRGLGVFQDNLQIFKNAVEYLSSVETIPSGSTPKRVEAANLSDE